MAARSRRRDLLSGAQAAVHVSEDASPAIRTFAVACGTTRPEAATIKAICAVLKRLDGKYQSDKAAWEANGASRSAFQHWKRTINLHLVDELDTASMTAMSVALKVIRARRGYLPGRALRAPACRAPSQDEPV